MTRTPAELPATARSAVRRLRTRVRARAIRRQAAGSAPGPATLLSYDVFDTVLVRATGSPWSTLLHLGHRLRRDGVLHVDAARFARLRAEAEEGAVADLGGPDCHVHLADVHARAARTSPAVFPDPAATTAAELDHEREVLVPVPEIAEVLTRPGRPPVSFTSDTVHTGAFLEEVLRGHDLFRDGDVVRSSSDLARSKTTGTLWQHLLDETGVPAGEVLHRGNDPWTDYASARRAGLRVHPYPAGNPTAPEDVLDGFNDATGGLSGRLAGASRRARLATPAASDREAALRDVAAGVAGPVVVAFLLWALGRARASGVQHVCFVSRDGQVLHDVARRLSAHLDALPGAQRPSPRLHYVLGSRQAWTLAALAADPSAEDVLVQDADVDRLSPEVLLSRLGLRCEDVRDVLLAQGLTEAGWSRPLGSAARRALLRAVLGDPAAGGAVRARAGEQRDLLLDHLAGTGLLDGGRLAVVDLSTGGTLHRVLGPVLTGAGHPAPVSLILGLRRGSLVADDPAVQTWFPPEAQDVAPRLPEGLVPALEVFALADHETVLRYERRDGVAVPVLKAGGGLAARRAGQPLVRATLVAVADALVLEEADLDVDLRAAATAVFAPFWRSPSSDEAAAWSGAALEDGWGEHSLPVRIAEPFRVRHLVAALAGGGGGARAVHTWRGASLRLSAWPLRPALTAAFAARDGVRRARVGAG